MRESREPLPWLLWTLALLAVVYTTRNPLYLLLTLAAVWAVAESVGRPFPWRLLLTLVGLGALWNFVTVHVGETVLFRLPGDWFMVGGPFTAEAALYGALNGLSLGIMLGGCGLLVALLSPRDVVRLTPPAFYEAGLVLSVALAFLPQGRETLEEIRQAQAIRGHRVKSLRDHLPLLLPLLVTALERALRLSEVLEARGFTALQHGAPRRVLALFVASLALFLTGSGAALLGWPRWLGSGLLLLGGGCMVWGLWLIGNTRHRTAYRPRQMTSRERLLGGAAVLVLLSWGALQLWQPASAAFEVYPHPQLPDFSLAAALPVLLLAAPALFPARWGARSGNVVAETLSRHDASCGRSLTEPQTSSPLVAVAGLPTEPQTGTVRKPALSPRRDRPELVSCGRSPTEPQTHSPPIAFDHVSFTYPERSSPVLCSLELTIPPGAFVLVTGSSGVGKSTLLRCINGLVPHASGGRIAGHVWVGAVDALRAGPRRMAAQVGFVVQSPETGFVTDRVEDEVVFSLENAGLPQAEIAARLAEALAIAGIEHLREQPLARLSGGEQQRVALAAALALRPPVLLLDEPLSQLDPQGAAELLRFLQELQARGHTIVAAEHRLERLLPLATQVILMEGAGPVWSGSPADAARRLPLPPPLVALGRALGWDPLPLAVEGARNAARALCPAPHQAPKTLARAGLPTEPQTGTVRDRPELASCGRSLTEPQTGRHPRLLRLTGLTVAYNGVPVLHDVELTVGASELVVLVGSNGAGKTTLLRAVTGLLPARSGRVWLGGEEITEWDVARRCRRIGYLPQEPDLLLFSATVAEELAVTLRNHGLPDEGRVAQLLEQLGLATDAGRYPRDLSVGERQRVAWGAVAITQPEVLLLDEPTRGLDMALKVELGRLLQAWCAQGQGVLLVTHDVEWAARFADRVVLLAEGRVVADGDPHDVLASHPIFAPQLARLFPVAGVLTVAEVLGCDQQRNCL